MSTDKRDEVNERGLRKIIQKKPYPETIGENEYAYSLLNKVNNSGIGTN